MKNKEKAINILESMRELKVGTTGVSILNTRLSNRGLFKELENKEFLADYHGIIKDYSDRYTKHKVADHMVKNCITKKSKMRTYPLAACKKLTLSELGGEAFEKIFMPRQIEKRINLEDVKDFCDEVKNQYYNDISDGNVLLGLNVSPAFRLNKKTGENEPTGGVNMYISSLIRLPDIGAMISISYDKKTTRTYIRNMCNGKSVSNIYDNSLKKFNKKGLVVDNVKNCIDVYYFSGIIKEEWHRQNLNY